VNPLNVPWGQRPKLKSSTPTFLGVRNEIARENSHSEVFITVSVQGVKGAPNGSYKLEWQEGSALKYYLGQLKLITSAAHAALWDETNPDKGRLRLHYIPQRGAHIVLSNPSVSRALQYQRSNYDAAKVAMKMGHGEEVVEVRLR
jgi:hypothetical protein